MSKGPGKSPYRCTFCRERLTPLPLEGAHYLRLIFLIRPFQCPHCFNCVDRPFGWIARIPIVGALARGSLFSSSTAQKSGSLPRRDGDIGGPVTKTIARFGRWVNECERRLGSCVAAIARGLWAIIWFVPGLFLGNRKRNSTDKRFLKSRD